MKKLKAQNGITLIALVITIIVMLILVAVSVALALNGGLFSTANQAKQGTVAERDEELLLDDGQIEVDDKKYASYQDYLDKKEIEGLPGEWVVAQMKPEGWSQNVTPITDGTNVIPLPNGFKLSKEETEDSIEEGLVLKDGANEFVWIPVANASSYTEDSFGPLTYPQFFTKCEYDSQEVLDYNYGTGYYNYNDFTYEVDKINVETSIQKYGGFYVGRYETTIEGTVIGTQKGKTVLTASREINTTNDGEHECLWWGLYKAQKDMYVNHQSIGSLMISSKQWDAIMTYTGYGKVKRPKETYTNDPELSGSAYATNNTQYDVTKNIYDLAGNAKEFTLTMANEAARIIRGGSYAYYPDSADYSFGNSPELNNLRDRI